MTVVAAAGALMHRHRAAKPALSAMERQTLHDAVGSDDSFATADYQARSITAGARSIGGRAPFASPYGDVDGEDARGHYIQGSSPYGSYKFYWNTDQDNYQGVYMTNSENARGFIDVLSGKDGFCDGNQVSVRIRAIKRDGGPVIAGTCFDPPTHGVLHQESNGCSFSVNLFKDAATDGRLLLLWVDGGNCTSYGTGRADLTSVARQGFWLQQ